MSSLDELVEIPVNQGFFWTTIPQGVRFGGDDSNAFVLPRADAVLSSGTNVSFVPSSFSTEFFQRLMSTVSKNAWYEFNGVFYANCGETLPDLYIMLEEHWIEIRGSDLLTDISEFGDNTLCIVNFLPSVDNFWVLGNQIYKDYYVYHNPDKGVTGWVPNTQRFKKPLQKAIPPTQTMEYEYDMEFVYLKFVIAAASWAATVGITLFLFTTTFSGIAFLNRGTRTKKENHIRIAKKLDSMSEE